MRTERTKKWENKYFLLLGVKSVPCWRMRRTYQMRRWNSWSAFSKYIFFEILGDPKSHEIESENNLAPGEHEIFSSFSKKFRIT